MNNKNNKIITDEKILYLLNKYNNGDNKINIYNIYLYQRAFATQLFIEEQKKLEEINEEIHPFFKSNETLEIIGDSIIGCTCVEYLEERFPSEREGFISVMKIQIIQTQGLCFFA